MKIFYVYKLRIKKSGLFYIGITNNIDRRKSQHISGINNTITKINYFRGSDVVCTLPAYLRIAREIIKGKKTISMRLNTYNMVKDECIFSVIDIKDTEQEAAELETKLLQKYKDHPKSLNTFKISCYAYNKTS